MGVAGEHLIAEREAVEGHDQRDAHLLAVGPVIAGITALGQRIGLRVAFEEGARHIVKQHLVLGREQFAAAPSEMRFKRPLVQQQRVECAVQAILVDLRHIELQQIWERRAPVPVLGNVQLARGFAQPRHDQHGGHLLPSHLLLAGRQQPLAQLRQSGAPPQGQRQVDIAKLPRLLDAHALQAHRNGDIPAAIIEQISLLRRADQTPRKCPRLQPPALIQLAKMRHSPLDDPAPDADAAHQSPVAMNLTVLFAGGVAQIHRANQNSLLHKRKYPRSALHPQITPSHYPSH